MGGDDEGEGPGLSYFINAEKALVGLLHNGAGTDNELGRPAEDVRFFRRNQPQDNGGEVGLERSGKNLLRAFCSNKLDVFQLGKEIGNLVQGKEVVGRHGRGELYWRIF